MVCSPSCPCGYVQFTFSLYPFTNKLSSMSFCEAVIIKVTSGYGKLNTSTLLSFLFLIVLGLAFHIHPLSPWSSVVDMLFNELFLVNEIDVVSLSRFTLGTREVQLLYPCIAYCEFVLCSLFFSVLFSILFLILPFDTCCRPEAFKTAIADDPSTSQEPISETVEEMNSSDDDGLPPLEANLNRVRPAEFRSDSGSDSVSESEST